VVEGTLADETTRELSPDEYVLSPVDTTIAGAKQVTVKAGAFSAWFPIMVNSSTAGLQSIALTKAPNKTLYALGEAFDKTGMVITGRYYDSEEGIFTEKTETVYAVVGYDPTRRGEQAVSIRVNRQILTLPVQVRVPADADITINIDMGGTTNKSLDCKQVWIKGEPVDVPENLKITIKVNGITTGFENGKGVSLADFSSVDTTITGVHTVTLTLDDASHSIPIYVVDIEPEVFFDYGYWRYEGNPGGTAPGGGEQYTVPLGRSLVLAPILNLVTDASFSWQVSGGACTFSGQNSEFFTLTPEAVGDYTVTLRVDGKAIPIGDEVHKTVTTTVVCSALPSPESAVEHPLFTGPIKHFSPGQFTLRGTGYGWSLGSVLGYEIWRWRTTRETNEFHIYGNAFAGWEEPGIVWVSCDENNNGLPDDTWYELKGSDDENDLYRSNITRRYAVNWFDTEEEPIENEYGQLIEKLVWVDSKGRRAFMGGGWPSDWGVSGSKVTFCGTMIRDSGVIFGAMNPFNGGISRNVDWGYVDAGDLEGGTYANQNGKFFVSNAMQRDGSPADLPWIDFIKVQTAVFVYGTDVGEISTEIHSADGLGKQTDFPLP
jgi:hypothetical protein